MTKRSKTLAAAILGGSLLAGGTSLSLAHAQTISPTARPAWTRGDTASDRNLRAVRRHLEHLIDQLQRDQRDYDGHRVAALNDLAQARAQLDAALQYDRAHPGH